MCRLEHSPYTNWANLVSSVFPFLLLLLPSSYTYECHFNQPKSFKMRRPGSLPRNRKQSSSLLTFYLLSLLLLLLLLLALFWAHMLVSVRSMKFGTLDASRAACATCFVASTYCLLHQTRLAIQIPMSLCVCDFSLLCGPSARSLTTQLATTTMSKIRSTCECQALLV